MNPKLDNRRQETFVITDAPLEQFSTSDLYTVFIVFDLNNSQNIQNLCSVDILQFVVPKVQTELWKGTIIRTDLTKHCG